MAAPADAASYFKTMAALRSQAPLTAATGRTLRQCTPPLSGGGDWQYAQFCPIPWLEISVDRADLATVAQTLFPREYFDWVKSYLREARKRQPSRSASAQARVYWALDVWAHVQYGLLALNLPIGDPTRRFQRVHGRGQPPLSFSEKLFGWSLYDSERAFSARTSQPRPGPFMLDVGTFSEAPWGSKSTSEVWKLVLGGVTPWIEGWGSQWIASKGGKDGSEFARADNVEKYALLQWRLWSVSDFDNFTRPRAASAAWPLGMGSRFACATLGQYVEHVRRYEPAAPEILTRIEGGVTYAYPSFSWVYERWLPQLLDKFVTLDYVAVLREHWQWFWDVYGPKFDAGGELSQNVHQPLTYTDLRYLEKANQAALDAQLAAVVQDPGVLCQRDMPGSKACVELAAQAMKARQLALAATGPLRPLADFGLALLSDAVAAIGAASGGGWPFFAVGNPFARVAAGNKLSTLPSGSTPGVFAKIAAALAQLQIARGFDIVSPPAGRADRDCTVRFTPAGDSCTVCVGEPEPTCAKLLPGYVQQSTGWGIEQIPFAAECAGAWQQWAADNPGVAEQLVAADPSAPLAFYQLCVPVFDGTGSFEVSAAAWGAYVLERLPSKPSLLQAFFGGFLRASSPVTVG